MDVDETGDAGGPQRLCLLASALAGRNVTVAPADPGEPAWTDGVTVFVDAVASAVHQVESVTVQASLLACGGLEPDVVRKLVRRPALARRYLAVEGQRALTANDDLLPFPVRSIVDLDLAMRSDSPAASLKIASGRDAIADPPASFGVIRPRKLLSAHAAAVRSGSGVHAPRHETQKRLAELEDTVDESADDDVMDPFSSPVGGGGAAGKLLQRLMSRVRQLSGGGPPGADSPTHRSQKGIRGAGAVTSVASALSDIEDADAGDRQGRKYPEWDAHRRRYRPDWCTVHEIDPPRTPGARLARPDVHALRRPLTRLGHRARSLPPAAAGRRHRRRRRGRGQGRSRSPARRLTRPSTWTACAVAAISPCSSCLMSPGRSPRPGTLGHTVHEQQRAAAVGPDHCPARTRRSGGAVRVSIAGARIGEPRSRQAIRRQSRCAGDATPRQPRPRARIRGSAPRFATAPR